MFAIEEEWRVDGNSSAFPACFVSSDLEKVASCPAAFEVLILRTWSGDRTSRGVLRWIEEEGSVGWSWGNYWYVICNSSNLEMEVLQKVCCGRQVCLDCWGAVTGTKAGERGESRRRVEGWPSLLLRSHSGGGYKKRRQMFLSPTFDAWAGAILDDFGEFVDRTDRRRLGNVRRFESSTEAIMYCFKSEHGNQKYMLYTGRLIHFSQSMHLSSLQKKLLPLPPTIFLHFGGQRAEFTISWTRASHSAPPPLDPHR